jgi:hypothetical protein
VSLNHLLQVFSWFNESGSWQWVTFKPNTAYTLKMMAKAAADGSKGKITTMGSGLEKEPEAIVDSIEWKEYTFSFKTGAEEAQNPHTGDSNVMVCRRYRYYFLSTSLQSWRLLLLVRG